MTKPRITLHVIMPNQISGPNSAVKRIRHSSLAGRYEFSVATQTFHAGGRVNLELIRDLRRQIKASNPDLVHLTGLQASGFHAVVAARLATRAPILVTIRGFSVDALSLSKFQRSVFRFLVEPITLALCTRFVTVTRTAGTRRLVRAFGRKYLGALHNAAPDWSVAPLSVQERERIRRQLALPVDNFIATVSGRMVTDKGIPTVLEVASRLPEGFTVCLVGDGPWVDKITLECSHLVESGRVRMLGPRSDVKEILQASDAFLFATLHENLSNALLEAMTLGLPVVVTDVGGNPEVVRHGDTGYLVAPGDAEGMTERLVALRDDPELARTLGAQGQARIEAAFSQEHIYGQLSLIYDALMNRDLPRGGRCPQ